MNVYTTHRDREEHINLVQLLLIALLIVIPLLSFLVVRDVWESGRQSYASVDEWVVLDTREESI